MRTSLTLLLPLAILSSLTSCRENDDPEGAAQLLSAVQADNYQSWPRAPGYETRRSSSAPHGDMVEIFVNPVVSEALATPGQSEWPVGSIIVKDGFDGDGMIELIAIMEKRDSGWYWAEYDGEGEILYSGAPSLCTDCHASGADFVRAFSLP